jgi:hypothetical protein
MAGDATMNALKKTARIRALNDAFRTEGHGTGTIVCTKGVLSNGSDFLAETMAAVRAFNDFTKDNDPYGEHDFGALTIQGQSLFFKIDYFDNSLSVHSGNPADDGCTRRVMTIMLASEY